MLNSTIVIDEKLNLNASRSRISRQILATGTSAIFRVSVTFGIHPINDANITSSISGVIYAPYQSSPVASGRFAIVLARGANAACTQAAVDVLNGYININALYFHVYDSSVDVGGTVIGDHVFY